MTVHQPPPLRGQIALVTGATRGCGRGIAVELGAAAATVYQVDDVDGRRPDWSSYTPVN